MILHYRYLIRRGSHNYSPLPSAFPPSAAKKPAQAAAVKQHPPGGFPLAPPMMAASTATMPSSTSQTPAAPAPAAPAAALPPAIAAMRAAMAAKAATAAAASGSSTTMEPPAQAPFKFDSPSPDDIVLAAQQGRPILGEWGNPFLVRGKAGPLVEREGVLPLCDG